MLYIGEVVGAVALLSAAAWVVLQTEKKHHEADGGKDAEPPAPPKKQSINSLDELGIHIEGLIATVLGNNPNFGGELKIYINGGRLEVVNTADNDYPVVTVDPEPVRVWSFGKGTWRPHKNLNSTLGHIGTTLAAYVAGLTNRAR